jgi:enoyl-CoA hydratase/carnithine racemase
LGKTAVSEQGFALTRDGAVAILTFDQPHRLNALSKEQMIGFGQVCRDLTEDRDIRCVVVTGEGRGFCAGADVSQQSPATSAAFARPARFKDTRLDFITPLLNLPKPTIAAVNGVAVGAGLGIALACDIRIAGANGSFLANFCDLGIPAVDGVPWLLSRLVGVSRALEMLYTGDRIDAHRAEATGLVSRVVADASLMDEALALARRIAAKPPVAVQMTRAAVVEGFGRSWREALAQQELAYVSAVAFSAHDIKEAGLARKEKRAPVFTDFIPFNPNLPDAN